MKLTILALVSLALIPASVFAAAKKSPQQALKKPFYLGDKEAQLLKDQLIDQKIQAETFTVTMHCDRYKRSPSADIRTVNCVALTVEAAPDQPVAKKKGKAKKKR